MKVDRSSLLILDRLFELHTKYLYKNSIDHCITSISLFYVLLLVYSI